MADAFDALKLVKELSFPVTITAGVVIFGVQPLIQFADPVAMFRACGWLGCAVFLATATIAARKPVWGHLALSLSFFALNLFVTALDNAEVASKLNDIECGHLQAAMRDPAKASTAAAVFSARKCRPQEIKPNGDLAEIPLLTLWPPSRDQSGR